MTTREKNQPNKKDENKLNKENTIKEIPPTSPHLWPKNTTLIAGDSMLSGVNENQMSYKKNVKVRSFSGARVEQMKYYLTPLIAKKPDNLFLHVGTNNAIDETSETIFDRITTLVQFIKDTHPTCKVFISTPICRFDKWHRNIHSEKAS